MTACEVISTMGRFRVRGLRVDLVLDAAPRRLSRVGPRSRSARFGCASVGYVVGRWRWIGAGMAQSATPARAVNCQAGTHGG